MLLLIHVPPMVLLDNVIFCPTHTSLAPEIAPGVVFTVTFAVVAHPVGNVYVIAVTPIATPPSVPDVEPIVAILLLPLLQTPPPVALNNEDVAPTQTVVGPVIPAGNGFTETVALPVIVFTQVVETSVAITI